MTIFLVNGKELTLEMRDENGVDWSGDFIGNTHHGMESDGDGNYICSQEDYEWWDRVIDDHVSMNEMIDEYKARYGSDEIDNYLQECSAFDVDIEDQPGSVRTALDAYNDL